jgi:hypothetical protein
VRQLVEDRALGVAPAALKLRRVEHDVRPAGAGAVGADPEADVGLLDAEHSREIPAVLRLHAAREALDVH